MTTSTPAAGGLETMTGHRIDAGGAQRVECHAPADANCRVRPDCNAEGWGGGKCDGSCAAAERHPTTPGHDCWAIEWVNAPGDLSTTCSDDPDPDIQPGADVTLTWHGDGIGVGWRYTEGTR